MRVKKHKSRIRSVHETENFARWRIHNEPLMQPLHGILSGSKSQSFYFNTLLPLASTPGWAAQAGAFSCVKRTRLRSLNIDLTACYKMKGVPLSGSQLICAMTDPVKSQSFLPLFLSDWERKKASKPNVSALMQERWMIDFATSWRALSGWVKLD